MTCTRWHRLIALEVGGDLDSRRIRGLDKHLEGCAACRDLANDLRSQREELVRIDREGIDSVTLGSVRHAVLAELAGRRRPIFGLPTGGRRLAFAGVAAVILVVAAVVFRQGATPSPTIVAERSAPTAVPGPTMEPIPSPTTDVIVEIPRAMPAPVPVETVEHGPLRLARNDPSTRGPETAISPSAPTEPMTVKILTGDPDVVIYWIVEPKGDKENA